MRMLMLVVAALGVLVSTAGADEYWITYEGNDLPENEGWDRRWGNYNGSFQGEGAFRTVEDSVLTMDSLYDLGVYDFAYRELPGQLDPDPGELFVAEWRLLVDETVGDGYDAKVGIKSDDARQLGIGCFPDHVRSVWEDDVHIPITAGVFHEYRVLSWDMLTYDLYIDGDLVHQGTFWQGIMTSQFGWGDVVSGAASLSHWDYARFGVVPEPSSCLMLISLCACVRRRRVRLAKVIRLGRRTP